MKQKITKNLIDRFSCSLVGRGKKIAGYKILLESLLLLREKNEKDLLNLSLQKTVFLKIRKYLLEKEELANPKKNVNKKDTVIDLRMPVGALDVNRRLTRATKERSKESFKKPILSSSSNNIRDSKKIHGRVLDANLQSAIDIKESLSNKAICKFCVDNVKPVLDTRKVRKGRLTYKVPKVSSPERQEGKAIALLLENASNKKKGNLKRTGFFSPEIVAPSPLAVAERARAQPQAKAPLRPLTKTKQVPPFFQKNRPEKRKTVSSDFFLAESFDGGGRDTKDDALIFDVTSTTGDIDSTYTKGYARDTSGERNTCNTFFDAISAHQKSRGPIFTESLAKEKRIALVEKTFLARDPIFFQKRVKTHPLKYGLSQELFDARNEKGESVEKKKQLHQLALQNRANLHLRWW